MTAQDSPEAIIRASARTARWAPAPLRRDPVRAVLIGFFCFAVVWVGLFFALQPTIEVGRAVGVVASNERETWGRRRGRVITAQLDDGRTVRFTIRYHSGGAIAAPGDRIRVVQYQRGTFFHWTQFGYGGRVAQ